MNNTRRVFVCLLGLVVILSILVFPVSAQGNDSGAAKNEEDYLLQSQRNLDRSLTILNVVATSMGVAVGLLTLVVVIVGGFGIFQIKSWHDLKKDVDEKVKIIENKVKIIENLKIKAEKDVETIRKEVANLPQTVSPEKPSDEVLRKLDDFSRHLETLELLGATLKPEDYLNRGKDLLYKKNYESALKSFDKAIELKPEYVETWLFKCIILDKLGRYEEAIKACDKAIELKPDYVEAWGFKCIYLHTMGRHNEALKACEKAIELEPDYAEVWGFKGVILHKMGRHNEALKAYDKSIELEPDDTDTWFNRACTYSLMGNKEKALSDLKKSIELNSSEKDEAKKAGAFKNLWEDEDFKNLVE